MRLPLNASCVHLSDYLSSNVDLPVTPQQTQSQHLSDNKSLPLVVVVLSKTCLCLTQSALVSLTGNSTLTLQHYGSITP